MRDVQVYGQIGWDVTAEDIRAQLEAIGEEDVRLRIHSPGGSVMEGIAMMTALAEHPGRVTALVDGMAASMAAVLTLQAEHVAMPENAWLMFHEASVSAFGASSEDLERMKGIVDGVNEGLRADLGARMGREPEAMAEELRKEIWLTGRKALAEGVIHETTSQVAVAADAALGWRNAPVEAREYLHGDVDNRGGGKMAKDFSIWQRLTGAPEKALKAQEEETEKLEDRVVALEGLLGEGGDVAAVIGGLKGRVDELEKDKAVLAEQVSEALKRADDFEGKVKEEASRQAAALAASQGVPEGEVTPSGEEPEGEGDELSAFEQWERLEGDAKRKFFAENQSAILRSAKPMTVAG